MFLAVVAREADFVPESAFKREKLHVYGTKFLGLSTNLEER